MKKKAGYYISKDALIIALFGEYGRMFCNGRIGKRSGYYVRF